MPLVTSENKQDFDANKMAPNIASEPTPEPSNAQYTKYAKLAAESTAKAKDERTHADASRNHGMAFGLAALPDNKTYHRSMKMHHAEQEDKFYRSERRKAKHAVKKEILERALKTKT